MISFSVYKIFVEYDFKGQLSKLKNIGIISFISIFLGLVIFIFSTYKPTIYGFDNRNLGAIRLFYTIFACIFCIYFLVRIGLSKKMISLFFSIITFILITVNINVKNSWIYANQFNNELFSKLKIELDKNHIESGKICLDYDVYQELKNNPNFILREPIFYNNYESPMLCEIHNIDPDKIQVFNIERKTSNCKVIFRFRNGKIIRIK